MIDPPLISVIITFYNQADFVGRALPSVLSQTYTNLDIIVVDDGSDDDFNKVIGRFSDKRLRVFRKENGGVASARNLGIKNAYGAYIAFLDGDDAFLPSKLDEVVSSLNIAGFPECMVVSGYYKISRRGVLVGRHIEKAGFFLPGKCAPDMRPSMTVYSRQILNEFGLFPENLQINEDGAFNTVLLLSYPVMCLSKPLVLWQSDDSGKSRKVLQSYDMAYEAMMKKVEYIKEKAGVEVAEICLHRHLRNNLFGFLSVGQMKIARRWYILIKEHDVALSSIASRIAILSVMLGINLYGFLRKIAQRVNIIFLYCTAVRLRKATAGWHV